MFTIANIFTFMRLRFYDYGCKFLSCVLKAATHQEDRGESSDSDG